MGMKARHLLTPMEFLNTCQDGTNIDNMAGAKGDGKVVPLQTWTGSEGSWRLRLPDFKAVGT